MINALLEEFAQYMGLEQFKLDENNEALLFFDEKLPVLLHFNVEQRLLTLDADLGRSSQDKTRLMQTLLEASSLWRELNIWFSLDPQTRSFHIQRQAVLSDFPEFQQTLEDFIDVASKWARLISASQAELNKQKQQPEQSELVQPAPMMGIPV